MFGLTQIEARLAGLAILLTIALLSLVGFGWHERHVGAGKCVGADTKAEAKQDEKDAKTLQKQQGAVISEGTTYETIIAAPAPVGPPVRLCHDTPHPSRVQAAPAAGSSPDAAAPVRATPGGDPQEGADVGPDLRANDRQANAQVAGLQAYIKNVCLVR